MTNFVFKSMDKLINKSVNPRLTKKKLEYPVSECLCIEKHQINKVYINTTQLMGFRKKPIIFHLNSKTHNKTNQLYSLLNIYCEIKSYYWHFVYLLVDDCLL